MYNRDMVHVSIIILSHNTKEITQQCLLSLFRCLQLEPKLLFEIIIIDNASTDDSYSMLRSLEKRASSIPNIKYNTVLNEVNNGFPAGNNQGVKISNGKYLLFLNSDVIFNKISFEDMIGFIEEQKASALTVRVELSSGKIDPASHRGFPTPWNAFTYFAKFEYLFGKIPVINSLVGGYHLTMCDLNTPHEIDSPTGAFYFIRKSDFLNVGKFDEAYFMYGEDIDLSFKLKQKGYKIFYYPKYTVLHLKNASGIKHNDSEKRKKTRSYFYESMLIFYDKHYLNTYPKFVRTIVKMFIRYKIAHNAK